jgi:phosphatidylserine/phosphatidylglycerophosphate/cardiolipin synthase-like enzyme
MILEQLVTSGKTTVRCVRKLVKRYRALQVPPTLDEEATLGLTTPGALKIDFFQPVGGSRKRGEEEGEPQQSHLKLMVVDKEVTVLGSGNLDRASWFTSQELGVAVFDGGVAWSVRRAVEGEMRSRVRVFYDSAGGV